MDIFVKLSRGHKSYMQLINNHRKKLYCTSKRQTNPNK
jgi:hypothetical protein